MQDKPTETPANPDQDAEKLLRQLEAELAAARIGRPGDASKRSAYRLAGILILVFLLLIMLGLAYYFTTQLPANPTPLEERQ